MTFLENSPTYRVSFGEWIVVGCLLLVLYFGIQIDTPLWDFEWKIKNGTTDTWSKLLPPALVANRFIQLVPLVGIMVYVLVVFKILFGKTRALLSLFVLISIPGFLLFIKVLNPDIWAGMFQTIAFFSGILYINSKSPVHLVMGILGILCLMFLFPFHAVLTLTGLLTLHLLSRNHRWIWIGFGLLCCIFLLLDIYLLRTPNGLMEWLSTKGFMFSWLLLIMGPMLWLGFWLAGILDINSKVARKDTFSNLAGVGLLVGFTMPSPFFYVVSALIIAKHLKDISIPAYPYRKAIQYSSVIVALIGFLCSFWTVFKFLDWFGGVGFYMASLLGIMWWGAMVVIIIMLITEKHKYLQTTLFSASGLLGLIILGIIFTLFYEQALASQDRLTDHLQTQAISKVAIEPTDQTFLAEQLTQRFQHRAIEIDPQASHRIQFEWTKNPDLEGFEFLPSMKVDSNATLSPWLYNTAEH